MVYAANDEFSASCENRVNDVRIVNLPDFSEVEHLHCEISPSSAAYNLIHSHCVVIATISWQLAHHQNVLLAAKTDVPISDVLRKRASLAKDGMINLIGDNPLPEVVGGYAPTRYVDEYAACIGGLLHDIGTYKVLAKNGSSDDDELRFDGPRYILHGIRGYNYLLKHGVSEEAAQFARNHTGVGLTKEQVIAQKLPLPYADYLPLTVEQEIVMVADKYNSKSIPPRFLTVDSYRRKAARFGESNARKWMKLVEKYGEPNIAVLADRFNMRVS